MLCRGVSRGPQEGGPAAGGPPSGTPIAWRACASSAVIACRPGNGPPGPNGHAPACARHARPRPGRAGFARTHHASRDAGRAPCFPGRCPDAPTSRRSAPGRVTGTERPSPAWVTSARLPWWPWGPVGLGSLFSGRLFGWRFIEDGAREPGLLGSLPFPLSRVPFLLIPHTKILGCAWLAEGWLCRNANRFRRTRSSLGNTRSGR